MTQSEAEKLARKWFVDNGIGFDGARLVKLTQFIREIENAAYERAIEWVKMEADLGTDLATEVSNEMRVALITPAKTADTEPKR